MKTRVIAIAIAAAWTLAFAGLAHARNPHCAGGIQYVVNGMKDKDKGNTEDYLRQMNKAVNQLTICSDEDPEDFEAIGYLGWAYAELHEAEKAGEAFDRAITGLEAKGDKKKIEWVRNNRDSYWANAFNAGIASINTAQATYPDYTKTPEDDAEKTLKEEATKHFDAAVTSLTRASQLRKGDAQTLRNLGTAHAMMGHYDEAAAFFQKGLALAPNDKDLQNSLKSVRTQFANRLIDEKKYDEAVAYFEELSTASPKDADLFLGLADARFRRAQTLESAQRGPAFKLAGDAYAKAASLKPDDADLPFNAALAYQNAAEYELAEGQWRATLKARPGDTDALSAFASTLAELGKFAEAKESLHRALATKPEESALHRQLGAVYTKSGDNEKATEELMVYLALSKGQAGDNPEAQSKKAPAASQAGKTRATMGTPEAVVPWEADGEQYETWFYWSKHQAYHFKANALQVKSDWSEVAKYATAGAGK